MATGDLSLKGLSWRGIAGILSLAAAACAHDLAGPTQKPDLAKGGKPGTGTGTLIPFVKLANLKALGCSSAHPYDINSGATVMVVGRALCSGKTRLWAWAANTGSYLIGDATVQGTLEGVGDNGAVVGGQRVPQPSQAIYLAAGVPTPLPPAEPTIGSYALGVSPDGHLAVGYRYVDGVTSVLLWTHNGTNFNNAVALTTGNARAVSNNGTVVGVRSGPHATVWTGSSWADLPEEGALGSEAVAINAAGTIVTGSRTLPTLPGRTAATYDQHVVWTKSGSTWTLEPLLGFNIDEGAANDVADLTDGRTVVVGFSWDDTNGEGGTQWPVVWIRAARETHFGTPQKLAQISEQWGATATAINRFGQVVGDAWTGSVSTSVYPVMWKLPPP